MREGGARIRGMVYSAVLPQGIIINDKDAELAPGKGDLSKSKNVQVSLQGGTAGDA